MTFITTKEAVEQQRMSDACQLTGKKPAFGNTDPGFNGKNRRRLPCR